jgi:hypothetical protein
VSERSSDTRDQARERPPSPLKISGSNIEFLIRREKDFRGKTESIESGNSLTCRGLIDGKKQEEKEEGK